MSLHWFVKSDSRKKKAPKWARSLCISDEGEVFIPSVLLGPEEAVFMMVAFDGVGIVKDRKHLYIPVKLSLIHISEPTRPY